MKILFIGDIVGKGGRRAVAELVPDLVDEYGCGFVIANGENMAGGGGITTRCLNEMRDAGVDVFTGGDHMWDQREFVTEIDKFSNVLRPANVCAAQPGRGYGVFMAADGGSVGVICLLGRTFMNSQANCPFAAADRIVTELEKETRRIIVDFHAEATSEKTALARFLDGRVSAVLGTHTHVPTADQQVFAGGTAFQCDVGMVGARESILGRDIQAVVKRFHTGMPSRFTVVNTGIRLHGCMVSVDKQGRCSSIERVIRDLR
jgi:metallophosphoesterase (TIGR00282 family)